MKKIAVILMVLILLIGGLAACGGTDAPEPTAAPVVEATPPAEEPEEVEPEEEEEIEEIEEVVLHEPDEAILEELADRTFDFRSVLDTETGAIFNLGDPKSVFEGILGEAEAFDDALHYANDGPFLLTFARTDEIMTFGDSGLAVGFQDGVARLILSTTDRFALKDATVDMAASDLSETFSGLDLSEEITMHMRGIGLDGEPALLPVALHEHLGSDADFMIHQVYVSGDSVVAFALMIHGM